MFELAVPSFARITDYVGVWSIKAEEFNALWAAARVLDFRQHFAAAPQGRPGPQVRIEPGKGGRNVAVIPIHGTMMKHASSMGGTSTIQTRRDIRSAAADSTVSGILLDIDSPGGTAAGTFDLAAEVKSARRQKPVWAQITDVGASAAYWVASQADAVYASNPTTVVGSIGTMQAVYDFSAAAERDGVKVHVFKTGPLKGMGVPGSAITDEHQAELQRIVNEMQTHFDTAVRSGRGMNASQLSAVRTGGVFLAADAVERRLIDGIRSPDSTIAALAAAK